MIVSDITSSRVTFINGYIGQTTVEPPVTPPVAPTTFNIELLLVASGGGGGGAGSDNGGGGGAGGLIYNAGLAVQPGTTYNIVVGASVAYRTQGQNSTAFNLVALGGGYGAGELTAETASAGGSGGGGNWASSGTSRIGASATQPTSASGGYGNIGGSGYAGINGAGGGGAGGAGGNNASSQAAPRKYGGPGLAYAIDGTSRYYSGGGGTGPTYGGLGSGSGNYGGGGNGGSTGAGGNSGPGVVIFKYPDTYSAATTTGNPTVVVTGGYRIYTFTGSGSVVF